MMDGDSAALDKCFHRAEMKKQPQGWERRVLLMGNLRWTSLGNDKDWTSCLPSQQTQRSQSGEQMLERPEVLSLQTNVTDRYFRSPGSDREEVEVKGGDLDRILAVPQRAGTNSSGSSSCGRRILL